MFHLSPQDIHLAATASNKEEAIQQIAAALTQAGYVSEGYVQGMLNRENKPRPIWGVGLRFRTEPPIPAKWC